MAAIPYSGVQGDSAPGTIQVPDDYKRVQYDPAAFGAGIGQGEQQLGQGVENLGGALSSIAIQQKQFERQATATDAMNRFQAAGQAKTFGDPNNPNDNGFMGASGKNALDAYPSFASGIEQDRQAIRDSIQDPVARQTFDRDSRRLAFTFTEQGARHKLQQVRQFNIDTNNAATDLSLRQASQSTYDDEGFLHSMADGVRTTQAALRAAGASDAVLQAGIASTIDTFQKQRVLQMAATGPAGVLEANKYLQANLDSLSPGSQVQLQNHLRPQVDKARAEGGAQEALAGGGSKGGGALSSVVHQLESSGSMAPGQTGDGGQAHGPMQVHGPALADVNQKLGTSYTTAQLEADPVLGKKVGDTYLQMMRDKYGRDDYALGAYNQGPGAMDAAIASGRGVAGLPGGGAKYVAAGMKLLGAAPAAASSGDLAGPPDLGTALGRFNAIADRDGYSFDARRQGEAMVHSEVERQLAVTHDARVSLQKRAGDVNAALADGRDVTPIAEDTIRRAFPAVQADTLVRSQREAQDTGWLMQQINFASPERLREIGADIDSGSGPISNQQRVRLGAKLTPAADGSTPDPNNDPEDYQRRRALSQKLVAAVGRRNQMLLDDPAGFVMRDPAVQGAVQAAQAPNATPDQRAAAVQAVMNRQAYLGVPEEKRMALPAAQIAADVHALTSIDPAKADMGAALQAKADAYGSAWSDVFGSYVRKGLPSDFQMLATMDRPEQVADRVDFQRALVVRSEPGGLEKLKTAAGKAAVKEIEDGVDAELQPFRNSTYFNQKSIDLYNTVRDSVTTLAYYRASRGEASSVALKNAADGLINKRYDFDSTMRVPKGMLLDARVASAAAVGDLKPEDMPVVRDSTPGMSDLDKQTQLLASIKAWGLWVPTPNDDGMQLVGRTQSNTPFIVTKRGVPMILKFDDIRGRGAGSALDFGEQLRRAGPAMQ